MTKYLTAVSAVALLAGSAMAADSASTRVFADVTGTCTITSQSDQIDLTNTAPDTWENGEFTYQCNFVGSPTLTFTSANGGMINPDNGTDNVDYGIYLNDVDYGNTPSTSLKASESQGGYVFNNITTTTMANTDVSPIFKVGPLDSFDVAGTYEDVLTIDIAP